MWSWLTKRKGKKKVQVLDLPEALVAAVDSITARLRQTGIEHALIGGVAVGLHGLVRATKDLDLLVDRARADDVHAIMQELGFETLGRSAVFGNYLVGGTCTP